MTTDPRIFYVYDVEALPNIWTCSVIRPDTGVEWFFEVSPRRNQSREFLRFLGQLANFRDAVRLVSFNGLAYDWPLVQYLWENFPSGFGPEHAFAKSQQIVNTDWNDRFRNVIWERDQRILQCDLMKIHGFDNAARSMSLKLLQISMKLENVIEFEVDWNENLPVERMDALCAYNRWDVLSTAEFHKHTKPLHEMRWKIGQELGISVENKSDIDMGETIFIEGLERRTPGVTGVKSRGPKRTTLRSSIALRDIILPYVQFETPGFQSVLKQFRETTVTETKGVFDKVVVNFAGLEYKFGTGGIHAARENCTYRATPGRRVITVDVASYYPNLAISNGLRPEHLGTAFVEEYATLYARRKELKKAGDDLGQTAIKLSLNAVFGKAGSKYSAMHDNAFLLSITMNGQLLLCMLCEQLAKIESVDTFNINTDGVTLAVDDSDMPRVEGVIEWWQNMTGLTLEIDDWSSVFQRDVNNYLGVETSGKIKGKGAFEWRHGADTGSNWHKNQSAKIIAIAAEEFLVNGTPVAETVNNCTDPFRFMYTLKVNKTDRAVLGGELVEYEDHLSPPEKNGKPKKRKKHVGGVDQQKTGRYYVSRWGEPLYKIMPPLAKLPHHYRPQAVQAGHLVRMANDLHDFDWAVLDRQFYIAKANELIDSTVNL